MNKDSVEYLNSDEGRAKLREAANILTRPDPTLNDAQLLGRVIEVGFPHSVAIRVFYHCLKRFAPMDCQVCGQRFKPRSLRVLNRPYCKPCAIERLPKLEKMKIRARELAMIALKKGQIKRQPCQACGFKFDMHMHHPDYTKPLDIVWLCARCHAAEHKGENVARKTFHARA